ncbi:hypothetical protein LCGC14_0164680 [marine sediment metagenome]|uniref:Uncharacterized protein n=1 Tax=marine sediment metagenome TaxID=412755 RepID=A0A0F9UYN2_9ZZZZ
MSVTSTVTRILFEGHIYGEWWIEEGGNATFADGDVGDQNHESIAFESALGVNFEYLYGELDPEEILDAIKQDPKKLAELAYDLGMQGEANEIRPLDAERYFREVAQEIQPGRLTDVEAVILMSAGANPTAVKWFEDNSGDAREYMMMEENWIRVQGTNFQMGRFDDDAKHRIDGFLQEEAEYDPEESVPDEDFIWIEEFIPKQSTYEADIHDMLNPHINANQIKQKDRQPAGLSPGMVVGGGEPQL